MKKGILLALLLATVPLSGCILPAEWQDKWQECTADSDCKIVSGHGCCGCPTAINKNYGQEYEQYRQQNACPPNVQVLCKACPAIDGSRAICDALKCRPA